MAEKLETKDKKKPSSCVPVITRSSLPLPPPGPRPRQLPGPKKRLGAVLLRSHPHPGASLATQLLLVLQAAARTPPHRPCTWSFRSHCNAWLTCGFRGPPSICPQPPPCNCPALQAAGACFLYPEGLGSETRDPGCQRRQRIPRKASILPLPLTGTESLHFGSLSAFFRATCK